MLDRLTPRQAEVLAAVCGTGSLAGAAARLGLGPSTIKNHLWAAYARLGVRGVAEACYRLGLAEAARPAAGEEAAGGEDALGMD